MLLELLVLLVCLFLFARWFAGVGVGAPFLPVRPRDIRDALELVEIGPQDIVIDLGSGDGRLLVAAVERGAAVVGYEINPFLTWLSRRKLARFGSRARVLRRDLRQANLSQATIIFIFGIKSLMPVVAEKIRREGQPGLRIVSFAFELPGLAPVAEQGIVKVYRQD